MSSDEHKDNERASAPGKPGLSRRSFLSRVGAAGIAVTASPLMATVVAEQIGREQAEAAPVGTSAITLKVNGIEHKLNLEPRVSLLGF
jgi:xanthine dehydrogenase YagT iron-sulfur-binding subunit